MKAKELVIYEAEVEDDDYIKVCKIIKKSDPQKRKLQNLDAR